MILEIIYRTILVIIVLFILAKIMGKKQVSQLNLFDYIVGITIGSVAADISLDIEKDFIGGLVCLIIYGLFGVLISYLTMKSIKLRRFFVGVPTILIENGKIIESGLVKSKFDINDLLEEARNSGYFTLEEINFAIMEANGRVSFLPNDKDKPITKKDMDLKIKKDSVVANIIIDEALLENNLKNMHKDIKWLEQQLKIQGFDSYKGILLATLDINDKFVIYKKNVKCQTDTVLE